MVPRITLSIIYSEHIASKVAHKGKYATRGTSPRCTWQSHKSQMEGKLGRMAKSQLHNNLTELEKLKADVAQLRNMQSSTSLVHSPKHV